MSRMIASPTCHRTYSAKRIAFHQNLPEHTVRGYVKDIYRHFGVGSRTELMHRFMVGDGGDLV